MRLWLLLFTLTLSLLNGSVLADDAADPLIGVRVSQFVTQNVLGSPPLPDLEGDGRRHLVPVAGYIEAKAKSPVKVNQQNYDGKFYGWTFGLGYSASGASGLGIYVFGLASTLNGSMGLSYGNEADTAYKINITGMVNTSYSFSGGLSYQLWSAKSFPITFGLLAGPFGSRFASNFHAGPADGSSRESYSATSFVYGAMGGAQALIKISKLSLNPYFLYYRDMSDLCQNYQTSDINVASNPDDACSKAGPGYFTLDGTFSALGVNVGLFGFSFGAYAKVRKNAALNSLKVNYYSLSYTINL